LADPDAGECNSGPFLDGAVPFWDAADKIALPGARELYTSKLLSGVATQVAFDETLTPGDLALVPFSSPGDPPDPAPNSLLYQNAGSTARNAEGLADEIVAYVRGCEYPTGVTSSDVADPLACQPRPQRLGDVFHSNPALVAKPGARLFGEPSYDGFKGAHGDRRRVLYAGANDGFLHAFHAGTWDPSTKRYDPGTGEELFGFMPWQARTRIKDLPIDAPASRNYYVDGAPQVADAWIYPTSTTPDKAAVHWRTILVGGMRKGGSQYYALDITDPSAATSPYPGYLWEFPREDDASASDPFLPKMGETWGKPIITRVRVRVGANDNGGAGFERWVAVVTGGYHPASDPNLAGSYDTAATEGRSIFILDLKTGEVLAEKKFDTKATDDQTLMNYAIAATPSVLDLDSDGFADVIYAGDLGGNMWKWVIAEIGEDRVNDGSGLQDQPNWPFRLFFQASSKKPNFKSFFTPAAAALKSGKLWLAFGTGERANLPYPGIADDDAENNRFYIVTDPDPYEKASPTHSTVTEDDLTDLSGKEGCTALSTQGYFFILEDGEKFVTAADIFSSLVIGLTFKPSSGLARCSSRGEMTLYVFDVECGKGYFDDGLGNPTRALALGSGLPSDPRVSIGSDGTHNRVYIRSNDDVLQSIEVPDVTLYGNFLYWRELR
jgi:type IV pilus assembly protein PilY1